MPQQSNRPPYEATLFESLLKAAKKHGYNKEILEDADRQKLTFKRLVLGALVLGERLVQKSRPGDTIGVLLPNVAALVVTLFGINAFGRRSALLNFTAGGHNLTSAARTAQLHTIITSKRFVETAKLEEIITVLENAGRQTSGREGNNLIKIIYLEDVRANIGPMQKLIGLLRMLDPLSQQRRTATTPDTPAVILFTSGTEGEPKGVVLTNKNLVANAYQIITHAHDHLSASDIMMNPLPMFHSFGLTAGTLMPLLNGMKVSLYPSPLHYREVPKQIGRSKATVLVATDTFLQGFARAAGPKDLDTVRLVVAGAERVKSRTRKLWGKSGSEIIEGYGATECAPVIACNLPSDNTQGSVGPLLPQIECRLEPVEGVSGAGRLLVRGPNVMAGYMFASNPGKIVPPKDGWHDTGDIVVNDGGRITIKGRAKRFAKIGGEMISLAAVEALISSLWPDAPHVVVATPSLKKGEQLVLVTEQSDAEKAAILKYAREKGVPELWVPKKVLIVDTIPVLGSGKVDLKATQTLAEKSGPLL